MEAGIQWHFLMPVDFCLRPCMSFKEQIPWILTYPKHPRTIMKITLDNGMIGARQNNSGHESCLQTWDLGSCLQLTIACSPQGS